MRGGFIGFSFLSCVMVLGLAHCVGSDPTNPNEGANDATADQLVTEDVVTNDATKDPGDASIVDAGACDLSKPFGPPVPLANLDTTQQEDSIWLTPDFLSAYVSATRPDSGGYDLFTTSRGALDAKFGALQTLAGPINTFASQQREPLLTGSGLTLYYTDTVSGKYQMYASTRTSTSVSFPTGQLLSINNSSYNETTSWISADDLTMLIQSTRGDGSNLHLYSATRTSTSVDFGSLTTAGLPNSSSEDSNAVMTPDQLRIYFGSTRVGGRGAYDVWTASRASATDGFGIATVVTELSTGGTDYPTWISPDGCTVYLAQQDLDASGAYDLFVADKPAR
ncbi:MAG: hypothetical protein ABI183_12990 [Polyangiaceae bacterium]